MVSERLMPGATETATMLEGNFGWFFSDVFGSSSFAALGVVTPGSETPPGGLGSSVGARFGRAFNIRWRCRVSTTVRSARWPSASRVGRGAAVLDGSIDEMMSVVNDGTAAA